MRETTDRFSIGDRVRLSGSDPKNWIDGRLQLRARTGTPATVRRVTAIGAPGRFYQIEFDAVGRLQAMSAMIGAEYLERLELQPEGTRQ